MSYLIVKGLLGEAISSLSVPRCFEQESYLLEFVIEELLLTAESWVEFKVQLGHETAVRRVVAALWDSRQAVSTVQVHFLCREVTDGQEMRLKHVWNALVLSIRCLEPRGTVVH
jgi:hypothetical protein